MDSPSEQPQDVQTTKDVETTEDAKMLLLDRIVEERGWDLPWYEIDEDIQWR